MVDVRIYVQTRIIGFVCDVVVVWQHVKRSFLPSSRKSGREKKQKLAVELGTPRPNGAIHSITIHMGGRLVTWQLAADEDRASHSVDGTRGCCLLTIGKPSHQSSGRQAWEVIAGAHRCLPFGHARHVTHVLRRAAAGQERGARCRRGPVTLTRPVMVAEEALVTVDRFISLLGTRPVRAPPRRCGRGPVRRPSPRARASRQGDDA